MNARSEKKGWAGALAGLPDPWEGASIHAHLTPPHGTDVPDELLRLLNGGPARKHELAAYRRRLIKRN